MAINQRRLGEMVATYDFQQTNASPTTPLTVRSRSSLRDKRLLAWEALLGQGVHHPGGMGAAGKPRSEADRLQPGRPGRQRVRRLSPEDASMPPRWPADPARWVPGGGGILSSVGVPGEVRTLRGG